MKKLLIALALVVLSSPLYAQTAPVQPFCVRRGYKPMCSSLKKAINQSPVWRQTKRGLRYLVILSADFDPSTGTVFGAATFGAVLDNPVSNNFPQFINQVTFNISPSAASTAGPVLVEILTESAIVFADTFTSLQQHGTAGPDLSDIDEMPGRVLTDEDFSSGSSPE